MVQVVQKLRQLATHFRVFEFLSCSRRRGNVEPLPGSGSPLEALGCMKPRLVDPRNIQVLLCPEVGPLLVATILNCGRWDPILGRVVSGSFRPVMAPLKRH